jgi:hypothetical protein
MQKHEEEHIQARQDGMGNQKDIIQTDMVRKGKRKGSREEHTKKR